MPLITSGVYRIGSYGSYPLGGGLGTFGNLLTGGTTTEPPDPDWESGVHVNASNFTTGISDPGTGILPANARIYAINLIVALTTATKNPSQYSAEGNSWATIYAEIGNQYDYSTHHITPNATIDGQNYAYTEQLYIQSVPGSEGVTNSITPEWSQAAIFGNIIIGGPFTRAQALAGIYGYQKYEKFGPLGSYDGGSAFPPPPTPQTPPWLVIPTIVNYQGFRVELYWDSEAINAPIPLLIGAPDNSVLCCATSPSGTSPGDVLEPKIFNWYRGCLGGGTVPQAPDLTDGESWVT